jgi:hypothetical protein
MFAGCWGCVRLFWDYSYDLGWGLHVWEVRGVHGQGVGAAFSALHKGWVCQPL